MRESRQCVLQVELGANGSYQLSLSSPEDPSTTLLLRHRLPCLEPFLKRAAEVLPQLGHHKARFAVQLHDEDPDDLCFRFDAPLESDGKGPLIPDPYALGSNGYAALRQQFDAAPLPAWQDRLPVAVWRGATTGSRTVAVNSLNSHLRYQLCRQSLDLQHWLDARFTAVVQCPDQSAQVELQQHLEGRNLLAPRMSPWHLALHRWIVDIDGNVNSWGLLWKLLSGSCILRVNSNRRQWYHERLRAWEHVVPIASDLSDLETILAWCQSHPLECAAIAQAGQRFATEVVNHLKSDQQLALESFAAQWLSNTSNGSGLSDHQP